MSDRIIRDPDELWDLPPGAVIRDCDADVFEIGDMVNHSPTLWPTRPWTDEVRELGAEVTDVNLPARVLWEGA